MTGETNLKFQRGLRAPDRIHDGDIATNRKPFEWGQAALVVALLILFLANSALIYKWG